jgi:2-methylcitrate dehydratase PrpD
MLLVDGALTFASIHNHARMEHPEILALRKRIVLIESEELAKARPRRQAIVVAKTRDGHTLSHRTFAVRGTADNPMTQAEVEAKALGLIEPVIGRTRARAILRALSALEDVPDIVTLRRLWQGPAKRSAGP